MMIYFLGYIRKGKCGAIYLSFQFATWMSTDKLVFDFPNILQAYFSNIYVLQTYILSLYIANILFQYMYRKQTYFSNSCFFKYTFLTYVSQTCFSILCCQHSFPIYIYIANTPCKLIELPVCGIYTLQMFVEIHSLSSLFVRGAQQTGRVIQIFYVYQMCGGQNIYIYSRYCQSKARWSQNPSWSHLNPAFCIVKSFISFGSKLLDCRSILKVWLKFFIISELQPYIEATRGAHCLLFGIYLLPFLPLPLYTHASHNTPLW